MTRKLKNMLRVYTAHEYWEYATSKGVTLQGHAGFLGDGPRDTYGSLDREVATGRAHCRACGEKIEKGDFALKFGYDFYGSGSHTCIVIFLHDSPCIDEKGGRL
jgi:hypothetical protein